MHFTIPEDILIVQHEQPRSFTKEQLINKYSDVFNSTVESLLGEVHFDLDPSVPAVQCAPRSVLIAMKAVVKAQLESVKYEADGHITVSQSQTQLIGLATWLL